MVFSDPRTCGCELKPAVDGRLFHSCKLCASQALDFHKRKLALPNGLCYNGYVDQVTGEVVIDIQHDWIRSSVALGDTGVFSKELEAEREKGLN